MIKKIEPIPSARSETTRIPSPPTPHPRTANICVEHCQNKLARQAIAAGFKQYRIPGSKAFLGCLQSLVVDSQRPSQNQNSCRGPK